MPQVKGKGHTADNPRLKLGSLILKLDNSLAKLENRQLEFRKDSSVEYIHSKQIRAKAESGLSIRQAKKESTAIFNEASWLKVKQQDVDNNEDTDENGGTAEESANRSRNYSAAGFAEYEYFNSRSRAKISLQSNVIGRKNVMITTGILPENENNEMGKEAEEYGGELGGGSKPKRSSSAVVRRPRPQASMSKSSDEVYSSVCDRILGRRPHSAAVLQYGARPYASTFGGGGGHGRRPTTSAGSSTGVTTSSSSSPPTARPASAVPLGTRQSGRSLRQLRPLTANDLKYVPTSPERRMRSWQHLRDLVAKDNERWSKSDSRHQMMLTSREMECAAAQRQLSFRIQNFYSDLDHFVSQTNEAMNPPLRQ